MRLVRSTGSGRLPNATSHRLPRTFEELLTENLDALYRTALRLCGGRKADAEDLLQDAVLRACEGFGQLRDAAAGRAWLFTILTRTHLNRVRAERRRAEMLSTDLDAAAFEEALAAWTPARTPEDDVAEWSLRERVTAALDAMDDSLRAVILLVDVEGFHQREAAAMLELPEGTIASRLFRARRWLRDTLAASERDLRVGRQP